MAEIAPDRNSLVRAPDLPLETEEQKNILAQAKRRWERCVKWESNFRNKFIDDMKFVEADAYNGWQWPQGIKSQRDIAEKPSLTINKTRIHCLQILNDARQNKSSIKVHAVGGGASRQSAELLNGVIRHIEYQSNAEDVYDKGQNYQVKGGLGFYRIATDYAGDDTLDMELFIRAVDDPLTVYMDPDSKASDGLDMKYAFVFQQVAPDDFEDMFPQYGTFKPQTPLANAGEANWVTMDYIRIAEYFWVSEKPDQLFSWTDRATGALKVERASKMADKAKREVIDYPSFAQRTVVNVQVNWALIIGDRVAETKVWPGRYIPLVPVYGEVTVIDGMMDRKGHVRALLDPQRMYNYFSSAAVEFGALQGKTPWVGPAAAIEGFEAYWDTANTVNHAFLPTNYIDDDAEPIPQPKRQEPPQSAPHYMDGMKTAMQEMMVVSGQHEQAMGQPGNERSGTAIRERQRKGDNATYHFVNNAATAQRGVGKILLDMIPKVYDAKRVFLIQSEAGEDMELQIDPKAAQAHAQQEKVDQDVSRHILNPMIGKYDVRVDVGPGFQTKREEAVDALSAIMTQAPEMTKIIGDLLLTAADFPMADEAAARLRRMVPPQALGEGPNEQTQQLMTQLNQAHQAIQHLSQEMLTLEQKLKAKDLLRDIDAYKAQTERLKASGGAMSPVIAVKTIKDALGIDLTPLLEEMMQGGPGPAPGPQGPAPHANGGPTPMEMPGGPAAPPPPTIAPGGPPPPPGG